MTSLYMLTLAARELNDRIEKVGRKVSVLSLSPTTVTGTGTVSASLAHHSGGGLHWYTDQENEDFANAWLLAHPETEVRRSDGYIRLRGTSIAGIPWSLNVGSGVCERVVVGKEWVPAVEGHYRDVTEVRCVDPLLAQFTAVD